MNARNGPAALETAGLFGGTAEVASPVRTILHIDLDAFYAQVEQIDDPSLAGKPVLVGGSPEGRGVVAAASYEAREFGACSAMPMRKALRLCPQAVVRPVRMARYRELSQLVRECFLKVTDLVEPVALDECFMDVTARVRDGTTGRDVAQALKACILETTVLSSSAGVGPNKLVAKIASDMDKPDGLVVVEPDEVLDFLHSLPVGKLWGVGPATEAKLTALGYETIGDLARAPRLGFEARFGKLGRELFRLAHGRDDRPVTPHREPKSMSTEETFPRDVRDVGALETEIGRQAEAVAERLARRGYAGHTVTLKMRYGDFQTVTRSRTLARPLATADAIAREARGLLRRTEAGHRPVRLIGVGVAGLVTGIRETPGARQISLWSDGGGTP